MGQPVNATADDDSEENHRPPSSPYRWVYILRRRHVHAFLNGPSAANYDPRTGAHIAVTLSGLLIFLLFLIVYHKVKRRMRASWSDEVARPPDNPREPSSSIALAAAAAATVLDRGRRRSTWRLPSASLDLGRAGRHSILLTRFLHQTSLSAQRRGRTYSV